MHSLVMVVMDRNCNRVTMALRTRNRSTPTRYAHAFHNRNNRIDIWHENPAVAVVII